MELNIRYLLGIVHFSLVIAHPTSKNVTTIEPTDLDLLLPIAHVAVEELPLNVSNLQGVWCAGVIKSKKTLITSADCFNWSSKETQIWLSLGLPQSVMYGTAIQLTRSMHYSIHENYTTKNFSNNNGSVTLYRQNNIAVIYLTEDIEFHDKIKEAEFLDSTIDITNKTGYILGWTISEPLDKFQIRILSKKECKERLPDVEFTEEMKCAITTSKQDVAHAADNGAHVTIDKKVAALLSCPTSYAKTRKQCDLRKPMILTDVRKHLDWIESKSCTE